MRPSTGGTRTWASVRPAMCFGRAGSTSGRVEIPANAQVYLCGPLPFMESVRSSLIEQQVAEADIHYEVFGPDKWLASA